MNKMQGMQGMKGRGKENGEKEEDEEDDDVEVGVLVDALCALLQRASRQLRGALALMSDTWQLVSDG